jgi:hypothetical protein
VQVAINSEGNGGKEKDPRDLAVLNEEASGVAFVEDKVFVGAVCHRFVSASGAVRG